MGTLPSFPQVNPVLTPALAKDEVRFGGRKGQPTSATQAHPLESLPFMQPVRPTSRNEISGSTGKPDPLRETTQEQRNRTACERDGEPLPRITAFSAAKLARYMAERSVYIKVHGNSGVDIEQPLTPVAYEADREGEYTGSGFFCRKDGRIITNMHVVERAMAFGGRIDVKLADGTVYRAKILAADPRRDVALLQLEGIEPGRTFKTLQMVDNSDKLEQGDLLAAYGNPRGLEGTFSVGHLSALNRLGRSTKAAFNKSKLDESVPLHQMTVPIAPGSSGGPVATMKGRLAGITQSMLVEPGEMNFLVPSNAIADFMTVFEAGLPIEGNKTQVGFYLTLLEDYPDYVSLKKENLYVAKQAQAHAQQEIDAYQQGIQKEIAAGKVAEVSDCLKKDGTLDKLKKDLETAKQRVEEQEKALKEAEDTFRHASANMAGPLKGGVIVSNDEGVTLGLKKYDVVTHFDGVPLTSAAEFKMKIKSLYAYQTYTLNAHRNGEILNVTVTPEDVVRQAKALEEAKDKKPA